jgi:hypothetical protein
MFELEQEQQKPGTGKYWLGAVIIVALVIVGLVYYKTSKPVSKSPAPATASVSLPANSKADPVHDLKVLRTHLGKDPAGVTAVWSVSLQNKSGAYTYSDIHYETKYIGANNVPIMVNQGTLPVSLGPGEETTSEFRDALYPSDTVLYNFRITGAMSAIR